MNQPSLFGSSSECIRLPLPDAVVMWYPHAFEQTDAADWFEHLKNETQWEQKTLTIYGRVIPVPRLTAWHGDPGTIYSYSGIREEPRPWTPELLTIRKAVCQVLGAREQDFNSVLLNYYQNGQSSVDWHSDDERELGENPMIASVSLGASRLFHFRRKGGQRQDGQFYPDHKMALDHGSLLVMGAQTQTYWEHRLPKTKQYVQGRINLTFRHVKIKR